MLFWHVSFFLSSCSLTLHVRSLASNSEEPVIRENLSDVGKFGLRLLEDLTALAAGGSVCAHVFSLFFFNNLV
jgi:hypothetical protein